MLGDDEAVPEGLFSAFVPKGRPNLAQEVQTLKLEMSMLQKQIKIVNLFDLANLIVQLSYHLEKCAIIAQIGEDAAMSFHDRDLKFWFTKRVP